MLQAACVYNLFNLSCSILASVSSSSSSSSSSQSQCSKQSGQISISSKFVCAPQQVEYGIVIDFQLKPLIIKHRPLYTRTIFRLGFPLCIARFFFPVRFLICSYISALSRRTPAGVLIMNIWFSVIAYSYVYVEIRLRSVIARFSVRNSFACYCIHYV